MTTTQQAVYEFPLTDQLVGWLGLNRAKAGGELRLHPVVGVRAIAVQNLVAELRDSEASAHTPTVTQPLYKLISASVYRVWAFSEAHDSTEDLLEAIRGYAMPFMAGFTDVSSVIAALEQGMGQQVEYTLPAAHVVNGEPRRGIAAVNASVVALGDATDPAANNLRAFAVRLTARAGRSASQADS